jgi:glycine cleavage system transcriptional repressor
MATQKTYLVISALGEDHPGIVNQISKAILDHGCNIEDSRMTVLGGEFAAMLLVEGKWNTLAKVENSLPELGRQLGMTIISAYQQRATGANLPPYMVDVVSMDHGHVNNLAGFFAERNINIEDMATSTTRPRPPTGNLHMRSRFSYHRRILADLHALRERVHGPLRRAEPDRA